MISLSIGKRSTRKALWRRSARRRLAGELLERRDLLASDFGDAPAPYPTTLADDGARHIDTGPTLGFSRDTEADGIPHPVAQGDGADENGVTLGSLRVGESAANAFVNVQGGPAKLDAWIDFNRNGIWDGGQERIASSLSLVAGFNTVTFDVPIDAEPGLSFARFRLSTAGGLGVTGEAPDGEVEDYPLSITGLSSTDVVLPHERIGGSELAGAGAFDTADFDGDGDVDFVAAATTNNELFWFENDGDATFTRHLIGTANVAEVVAGDLDGDGDIDFAVGAGGSGGSISWYQNTPTGFVPQTLPSNLQGIDGLDVGDIDGDGDLDLAFTSRALDLTGWFANNGSGFFAPRPIGPRPDNPEEMILVDFDQDGDLDFIVASNFNNKILWLENEGALGFDQHSIAAITSHPIASLDVTDVDGDGDYDVLMGSTDGTLDWYEQFNIQSFQRRNIRDTGEDISDVTFGDLDGDGDTDVLATLLEDDQLVWYENDGSQSFTEKLIRSVGAPHQVTVLDIDQDGDLDVAASSTDDNELFWHRNIDAADFGDAPVPYPTTIEDGGAYHVAIGPSLGPTRDTESDGQPSDAADGDGSDEDGVLFGDIRPGEMAGFNIDLQNASAAKVTAWIDWNGNGTWEPEERIRTGADVIPGLQTLNYTVPADALPGQRMARVRIGSQTIMEPGGYASDGEVEDYVVGVGGDVLVELSDQLIRDVNVELDGDDLLVFTYSPFYELLSSTPLASTNSLTIDASDYAAGYQSLIQVDFREGFFALPGGISFQGDVVAGSPQHSHNVRIVGTGATNATYKTDDLPVGNGSIDVELGGTISTIYLSEMHDVRISSMVDISIDGALEPKFNDLYLGADNPIQLGPLTRFTGSQLDTVFSTSEIIFGGDLVVDVGYRGGIRVGAFANLFFAPSFSSDFASRTYQDHPVGTEWDIQIDDTAYHRLVLFDIAQVSEVILNGNPDESQSSDVTSIEVVFEDYVEVDTGAFQVEKRGQEGGPVENSFTTRSVGGNTVATITFSGAMTRGDNNALIDGNYDLTIDPTKVVRRNSTVILDGNGDQQQGGTYQFGTTEADAFFAFFGDSDGDRDVDGQDYGRFGLTFLKAENDPNFNSAFDSDGDGDVDGQDYGRFGQRFLQTLPFE